VRETVEKVNAALEKSEYDAILVFGPDNVQYLSGAHLPFTYSHPERYMAVLWPQGGEPACICPVAWEASFKNLSWMENTIAYTESGGTPSAIVQALAASGKVTSGTIGLDVDRVPVTLYESLKGALEGVDLIPCDEWIRGLRMVKTEGEVNLLEDVANRADHAIFGTAHHVLVTSTRSEMSLSEEIRVHAMERELDVVGHHSVGPSASGEHAKKFWPLAPKFGVGFAKALKPGEYVRMELKTGLEGYWSDAARMMVMGEPTEKQLEAYSALVALREAGLRAIKLGVKCSEVYEEVKKEAALRGAELVSGLPVGHGVGVTSREPPYLGASDDTELVPGMVLVLDPVVLGPEKEIMMSKDTVVVTEDGCRLVGWYKDWREPYIANYTL